MSILKSTNSGTVLVWKATLEKRAKKIAIMLDSIVECDGDGYVKMKYTYPYIFMSSFGKKQIGIADDEINFYPKHIHSESEIKDKILECFKKRLEPDFDIEDVNWDYVKIDYRL